MATNYIAPTWRMPENGNQSKSSNYSLNFIPNSYISFPAFSLTGDFTVSFWIKPRAFAFATIGDAISSNWLRIQNSTRTDLDLANTQTQWESGATFTLNEWQHVVLRRDANNVCTIFRNGIHYTNNAPTKAGTFANLDSFGKKSNANYFNGQAAGVCVFDYALSPGQVETLYGDLTSGPGDPMALPTPPIVYYELGGNANLTSGSTLPNFPNLSVGGEVAYSNYSVKFATFDYFNLNNSGIMGGKNTYSISAWFKLDQNASSAIFSNWYGGTSVNYLLRYNTSSGLGIQWYVYSNNVSTRLDTGYIPTIGSWTHVVAVKDPITSGGQIRVYINGVSTFSSNSTNLSSPTPNKNQADQIAVFSSGSNFVNGNVSNVAYWTDTALTQPQAEEIYNNGKTVDLNNLTFTAPTNWLPLDEKSVYYNGSTLRARDVINNIDASGINLQEENIVGDAPGSQTNGTGINFDITDLEGDMNGSSKNAYSINMADYGDGATNPANSGRSTEVPGNP